MKAIDGFDNPPHSTEKVWEVVKEHFNVKNHLELVDLFYTKFDKPHVSGLCKKLAELANLGDELCKHIFSIAGRDLAKSLSAVIHKAHSDLTNREGGIHILCVGSLWLSWNLLKPGFLKHLQEQTDIKELSLMRIKTCIAIGAAYLVADHYKLSLKRDYSKNYEVFYRFQRADCGLYNND